MKKYKLIKKYPNSVELGTIIDKSYDEYGVQFSKYPEFWEEVIEKDYEILSIIGTNKHPLPKTTLYLKDVYKKDFAGHLNDESNCWQIHSVKRLSDGEIFTVDKYIDCNSWFGRIIKFEIIDNEMRVFMAQNVHPNKIEPNYLKDCRNIKKPLFTTEDGVDIFERDSFYYIGDAFNVCSTKCLYEGDGDFIKSKKFSTKEKAEEFIILNKPYLSINDVINNYHYTPSSIKHRLTELIKSRIFWKKN